MADPISPVADTGISPIIEFQASALKNGGSVLDAAEQGVVRVRRRSRSYLIIREDSVATFIIQATDRTPKTLAELLHGVTPADAVAMRDDVAGWLADPPRGSELI